MITDSLWTRSMDRWLGHSVREIPSLSGHKELFLTFDDGPCQRGTEAVLQILSDQQAHATFFVVAEKAKRQREQIHRIQDAGHTLGNHSSDHSYRYFFRRTRELKAWIQTAEEDLHSLSGKPSVGFRPPAGVCTPGLKRALYDLKLPLILWRARFFDSTQTWHTRAAEQTLQRLHGGEIILLHDRQHEARRPRFLETLGLFLRRSKEEGFRFRPLTRAACLSAAALTSATTAAADGSTSYGRS